MTFHTSNFTLKNLINSLHFIIDQMITYLYGLGMGPKIESKNILKGRILNFYIRG